MHYLIDPVGLKHCHEILSTTLRFNDSNKKSCRQNCHSDVTP